MSFLQLRFTHRICKKRFLRKPKEQLEKLGLHEGQTVLDYGSYSIPAAKLVGEEGTVYALDIHPLAIKKVEKRAMDAGVSNVKTIQSHTPTDLPDECIDIILLYDVLHKVNNKKALLEELNRVLKFSGILSVKGDHLSSKELKCIFSQAGVLTFIGEQDGLHSFKRTPVL